MAKLKKERSYNTTVWKITGPKDGPLRYSSQFKAMTGEINGHEQRDCGMIFYLLSFKTLEIKGATIRRRITQRFAIKYDDIEESEVSLWDGKSASISSEKIVII